MYCIKCGRELTEDQTFCPVCGLKVGETDFQREEKNDSDSYTWDTYSYGNDNNQINSGQNNYNGYNVYNSYERMVRPVSFWEAIVNFYKGYVDFNGRATRSEFWFVFLYNMMVGIIISIPAGTFVAMGNMTAYWVLYGIALVFSGINLLPGIAVAIRRLHDTGRSGVWYLVSIIPVFGVIVYIMFMCLESDADNMYGPRKTI